MGVYLADLLAVTVVIVSLPPAVSLTSVSATTIAHAVTLTIVNVPLLLDVPEIVIEEPARNHAVTNPLALSAIVLVEAVNEIVVAVYVEAFEVSFSVTYLFVSLGVPEVPA